MNGEKGVAQCVGSLCVHALMSSLCECVVDKKGWEGHREKTRKRKKGRVFWEKGEKEKQPLQKPKHTNQKKQLFSPFSSFLFDFSPFFFSFSHFKNNKPLKKHSKSTQMTDKKYVKAQSVNELDVLVTQGDIDTKRELAIQLMEGNGVPQNHSKAVALLEDCVALGDADSMLILAQCCALGHGMEQDLGRAKSLISKAARKGNKEALSLIRIISDCKGQQHVDLSSLLALIGRSYLESSFLCLSQGKSGAN